MKAEGDTVLEGKGFLVIKNTYPVHCTNCGFVGSAVKGKEIVIGEDAFEYCPACGAYALQAGRKLQESR